MTVSTYSIWCQLGWNITNQAFASARLPWFGIRARKHAPEEFWILKIFCRGTTHLKLVKYTIFHTSPRQTVLNQKTRQLSCPTGVHNGLVSSGLSNTIKETDNWILFLARILCGSLEAISCQDLRLLQSAATTSRKWFCLLITLAGIISQVVTDLFFDSILQQQN